MSVANCLERHGATVHSGDLDPVGFDQDVTGLRFVSATDHRRANSILDVLDLYGGGLFVFARSDPDAVRLQQDPAFGGEEAPFRRSGSVLYIAPEGVAAACL